MVKIRVSDAISLIANIGVLAGLGFLAYEIHQNTQAVQGATVQALAEQGMDASFVAVGNPELRLAYARAGRGLEYMTPEDASILGWWYNATIRIAENRYRQSKLGTLSADIDTLLGGGVVGYRHPYFGEYWRNARANYSADFAEWVDKNLVPLVQSSITTAPSPDLVLQEVRE